MTAAMANIAVSEVRTAPVLSRLSFALKKAIIAIIVIIIVHILFESFEPLAKLFPAGFRRKERICQREPQSA
jgi:hypothetical protein